MHDFIDVTLEVSTHSRPKAAAIARGKMLSSVIVFQHTAARRRLLFLAIPKIAHSRVSTHSRPKAAASLQSDDQAVKLCFNTQPPEGGCQLMS